MTTTERELELPTVANRFSVSTDTVRRLVRRYPELSQVVRRLRPGGPHMFGPEAVELTRRLLAQRDTAR
jgi:hypothetical protein